MLTRNMATRRLLLASNSPSLGSSSSQRMSTNILNILPILLMLHSSLHSYRYIHYLILYLYCVLSFSSNTQNCWLLVYRPPRTASLQAFHDVLQYLLLTFLTHYNNLSLCVYRLITSHAIYHCACFLVSYHCKMACIISEYANDILCDFLKLSSPWKKSASEENRSTSQVQELFVFFIYYTCIYTMDHKHGSLYVTVANLY